MELKKLSWLLRALLVLIGLALAMRLRLAVDDLVVSFRLLSDPSGRWAWAGAFTRKSAWGHWRGSPDWRRRFWRRLT